MRILAAAIAAVAVVGQQQSNTRAQQQSNTRANWPCGARIDPAYFFGAEGTGGQLLLLTPAEIGGSMDLSLEFDKHPETIFRLGGTINPGVHDFRVPIDGSVESAMFSISVQCLQSAEIVRPSGGPPTGDGVSDLSNFVASRMVIVTRPEPGVWTVRTSGSGLAGVIVKARSEIGIESVEFAPVGGKTFANLPVAGVENAVRIHVSGRATHIEASLVDAAAKPIGALPLDAPPLDTPDGHGTYLSRFTPGPAGFRVMITGRSEGGTAFQRMYAPLFTVR